MPKALSITLAIVFCFVLIGGSVGLIAWTVHYTSSNPDYTPTPPPQGDQTKGGSGAGFVPPTITPDSLRNIDPRQKRLNQLPKTIPEVNSEGQYKTILAIAPVNEWSPKFGAAATDSVGRILEDGSGLYHMGYAVLGPIRFRCDSGVYELTPEHPELPSNIAISWFQIKSCTGQPVKFYYGWIRADLDRVLK